MPIDWSSEGRDATKPLSARGAANARPTPHDRALSGLKPVPDESDLEKWARQRDAALDFVPQYGTPQSTRPSQKERGLASPRITPKVRKKSAALPPKAAGATSAPSPGLQIYKPRKYGTVNYQISVVGKKISLPGDPPLMRQPGPHATATTSGYEYLQDRVLQWAPPARAELLGQLAMDALQSNPNRFFPFQVLGHNGEKEIILGRTYDLTNRPSSSFFPLPPGRFPVMVTQVTPTSFTFTTLEGHFDGPGSKVTFSTVVDSTGLIHLEHKGLAVSDQPSPQYLIAPTFAEKAWDIQAANLRRWLSGPN
jgi:hypothetical protein